jgi:uncharacterized protein YegJ (DUF2314 family)
VIEDFSWADADHIGYLINFFAQAMAEGATVVKTGEFDLDLRAIRNYGLREPQLASLKSNATAKALLSLRKGRRDEGDPPNRLIEIAFDRYPGPDLHARQEALLSTLFGWEDSVNVRGTRHSDALLAASRRAREKLPGLREQFNTKMRPGEYILVKVPFPTLKDGDEYMWVEVASWSGDKMKGLLKNEPVYVPMLHAGQMVQVSESKVFDYIHVLPDGTQEGNETGRIIEAQSR